jgi:hypothetical protein
MFVSSSFGINIGKGIFLFMPPIPSISLAALSSAATLASTGSAVGVTPNPTPLATTVAATAPVDPAASLSADIGLQTLQYPMDGGQYYIAFFISKYTRASVTDPASISSDSVITLPVPAELMDTQSVSYSPVHRSIAVEGAIAAFKESIHSLANMLGTKPPGGTEGAYNRFGAGGQGPTGSGSQILQGLGGRTAVEGANILAGGGGAVGQTLGIAPNPFLTVELISPNFKEHTFSWKLSPSNPQESTRLKAIINRLKKHSLPDVTLGNFFLTYPDVFLPMLVPNEEEMYAFKYCVMTNLTVNWAGAGVPAFFTGTKAPAEVFLQMHLMEIELWLSSDAFFKNKTT